MNLKEHQHATGSGMISIQNGIITINDEYVEHLIMLEVSSNSFPSSIDINTPVIVNTSANDESYQLVLSCSIDYVQGITINHFQGCIVSEDCEDYKFYLSDKLQKSIESSIFYEYNSEMF